MTRVASQYLLLPAALRARARRARRGLWHTVTESPATTRSAAAARLLDRRALASDSGPRECPQFESVEHS